ncbi:MAG TPA: mechanosensitive ion channel domain-containing protein [Pyrinomonadaceae bacterium]|jgi:potassium-dependent mechanosensitive channel|nr:mechanosensitive ion channel domain-containing protein [Pyrinomonadaceae bacterium]
MFVQLTSISSILQDTAIIARVWAYLTRQFTFGRITVSVSSVIIGALVVLLTIFIARWSSVLIERRLANRRHIDPGLRYTICRLAKYVVITIGSLVALKQAFAIDLTSIAVIFTALSVGIGFGLQYIAADIASGFILLFERPIRIGDRITIGEDEGDVQSINLRTTVVTTNDRIAIIVPNSKLVGQRVVNWSYGDPRARISIPISVAYDSDIELVTHTLIEAAEGVSNVLEEPKSRVQFLKFGDYSLDFRLLVWTNQPRRHVQIRSDINYRIARLFRARSIRIPYPTQEFLLKGIPRDLEPSLLTDNDLSDNAPAAGASPSS